MKLVVSLEIEDNKVQFVNVERLVQNITDHIIRSLIEEKDFSMEESDGSKNPKALDLVMAYDDIIGSIEVRKWTKKSG